MKPFYNEHEKKQWIAHNCDTCTVLFMCNLSVFINMENVPAKLAERSIGIGFDGFLEPNCKSKIEKLKLKNT